MFPLRDENPSRTPAFVTWLLIAINLAVWIFIQGGGSDIAVATSVCNYGLIPGELLLRVTPGASFAMGEGLSCVMDPGRAPFHVLSSMFMHGSWGHILGNMWFLFIFGDNVEDAIGHLRYAVFYLVSGVVAAGLQVAMDPTSMYPMVGASGAISGVLGAYLVLYPTVRVRNLLFLGFWITTIRLPAWVMLGYWILLQFLGGFGASEGGGGTAFFAHIGGFLAGIVGGFLLGNRFRGRERWGSPLEQ